MIDRSDYNYTSTGYWEIELYYSGAWHDWTEQMYGDGIYTETWNMPTTYTFKLLDRQRLLGLDSILHIGMPCKISHGKAFPPPPKLSGEIIQIDKMLSGNSIEYSIIVSDLGYLLNERNATEAYYNVYSGYVVWLLLRKYCPEINIPTSLIPYPADFRPGRIVPKLVLNYNKIGPAIKQLAEDNYFAFKIDASNNATFQDFYLTSGAALTTALPNPSIPLDGIKLSLKRQRLANRSILFGGPARKAVTDIFVTDNTDPRLVSGYQLSHQPIFDAETDYLYLDTEIPPVLSLGKKSECSLAGTGGSYQTETSQTFTEQGYHHGSIYPEPPVAININLDHAVHESDMVGITAIGEAEYANTPPMGRWRETINRGLYFIESTANPGVNLGDPYPGDPTKLVEAIYTKNSAAVQIWSAVFYDPITPENPNTYGRIIISYSYTVNYQKPDTLKQALWEPGSRLIYILPSMIGASPSTLFVFYHTEYLVCHDGYKGDGLSAELINDTRITDATLAKSRVDSQLMLYGDPEFEGPIETWEAGHSVGELVPLIVPELNYDDNLRCVKKEVRMTAPIDYNIVETLSHTAVRAQDWIRKINDRLAIIENAQSTNTDILRYSIRVPLGTKLYNKTPNLLILGSGELSDGYGGYLDTYEEWRGGIKDSVTDENGNVWYYGELKAKEIDAETTLTHIALIYKGATEDMVAEWALDPVIITADNVMYNIAYPLPLPPPPPPPPPTS